VSYRESNREAVGPGAHRAQRLVCQRTVKPALNSIFALDFMPGDGTYRS
jgi:hypothetical protein